MNNGYIVTKLIQLFQTWHDLCSALMTAGTFNIYYGNTNNNNLYFQIRQCIGEHLGHLKYLKYKRKPKECYPMHI